MDINQSTEDTCAFLLPRCWPPVFRDRLLVQSSGLHCATSSSLWLHVHFTGVVSTVLTSSISTEHFKTEPSSVSPLFAHGHLCCCGSWCLQSNVIYCSQLFTILRSPLFCVGRSACHCGLDYIRSHNFLVPVQCTGNLGCFPQGKRAATVQRYPVFCFFSQCAVFSCFRNAPNSDMDYRIF